MVVMDGRFNQEYRTYRCGGTLLTSSFGIAHYNGDDYHDDDDDDDEDVDDDQTAIGLKLSILIIF